MSGVGTVMSVGSGSIVRGGNGDVIGMVLIIVVLIVAVDISMAPVVVSTMESSMKVMDVPILEMGI